MNRLTKLSLLFGYLLFSSINSVAQEVETKRLMRNINVPLKSHIFPSLTGDGLFMIFYSDYSNTGTFELKYSKKTAIEFWEEAKYVENLVKHHNDHFGSYNISYDGRSMVFSSHRASGIGKYDIWITERSGDSWSTPQNLGKPLNSPENDGNPCLSADGRSIYFMRCQSMDAKTKSGCKLYVAKKVSDSRWGEAQELPAHINAYNATTPRIMVDNETLIYSSERPGGKGGLDLYLTRNVNNTWTEPVPLDFLNTARNDEFVSVPARGDIIYYTDVYKDQHNIFKAIIPEEFRPKKVMLITGNITFTDASVLPPNISIQAFDAATGELVASVKPEESNGSFFITLPEGRTYDFSVFPMAGDHTYYSDLYNLEYMQHPVYEKVEIPLEPLRPGAALDLSSIVFEENNTISRKSDFEMRRLKAVLQKNPSLNVEVSVYINEVKTDSIPQPGLTKVVADTSFLTVSKAKLFEEGDTFSAAQEDSLATLGYMFLTDKDVESVYYKLRYTYTNDDSREKAQSIANKLVQSGIPAYKVRAIGRGDMHHEPWEDSNREYKVVISFF